MKNISKTALLFCAALAGVTTGCNDAPYDTLGMHSYINESASNSNTKVTITELGANTQVTVCVSEKLDRDATFELVYDPSLITAYNLKMSSGYLPLPEELIELPGRVTIEAGSYNASPVNIHILPVPAELAGDPYALPLRLVSVDKSVPVTPYTGTYVIVTEAIINSSLPIFNGGASFTADGFPQTLPQFTVECRFQISNTSNRNRSVFNNGGSVLLRFEDPQSNTADHRAHSLVQFQGSGWYLNPTRSFVPNEWQHLALTYDGTAVVLYVNGTNAGRLEGVCAPLFGSANWFGGDAGGGHGTSDTWWRGCNILCTEMRIWSTARTEAQIINNMNTTSAKSQGLLAYWRVNSITHSTDGDFHLYEDLTGNGHTLRTMMAPSKWVDVLSTDTTTPW